MYERRLKILLVLVSAVVAVLVMRTAQVQVVQRDQWVKLATETQKRSKFIETTRGAIKDRRGRDLAVDKPCTDACVDYRAIIDPPDADWVKDKALARLRNREGDAFTKAPRARRKQMLQEEQEAVVRDIGLMWGKLAKVSSKKPADMTEIRSAIVRRVEMRRRYIWYHNYQVALAKQGPAKPTPLWQKWLLGESSAAVPEVDNFVVTVEEQFQPHVILRAIDADTQIELGKHIDDYPGLELHASTHRFYPYGATACHVIGHLARVDRDDLDNDPSVGVDELRQYYPNELTGRDGAEALCEPILRGARGKVEKVQGDPTPVGATAPVPGQDVRLSIDVELQRQIESAFADATIRDPKSGEPIEQHALLHGAAVVLDVKTNQVLALVSYPTFDLNELDEKFAELADDDVNKPLFNRATMSQLEPGSTVKPMVGLSAITAGVMTVDSTVECTGFLVIPGDRNGTYNPDDPRTHEMHTLWHSGRCWVASRFMKLLGQAGVAHHPVPIPHPTGFLTYSDALERSCNIYFETVADRMGLELLRDWFTRFGLGRPTGIGIAEARGRLPKVTSETGWERRSLVYYSGIGQSHVNATPIQMANIAATLARRGIWMRPILTRQDPRAGSEPGGAVIPRFKAHSPAKTGAGPTTAPAIPPAAMPAPIPDRVDLHLSEEGVVAAWSGMYRVVNGEAGTGKSLVAGDQVLKDLGICGKTGTAQAAPYFVKVRNAQGRVLVGPDGRPMRRLLEPSLPGRPNPAAPWYRSHGEAHELNHSWYIGFAPADNPKVAFAVMVEYGISGGSEAGSVARAALKACIEQGYLTVPAEPTPAPPREPQAVGDAGAAP